MLSKIVKDMSISGLGELVYVVAIYAANATISRFLGAEGVGVYAQAMAVVFFASLLAQWGFDVGILRFVSLYLARDEWGQIRGIAKFTSLFVLITGVIWGVVVFGGADLLAISFFNEPKLTVVLRIFALTVPLVALRTIWLNGIQAFQRTDYRIYIGRVFVPLVSAGSIALLLYLGWGWNAVLISTLLTAVTSALLAHHVYSHLQAAIPNVELETPPLAVKKWMSFCYPLFFSQLLTLALPRTIILILGYFQNSADVGVYEIASKIALLVQIPLDISSFVFAPIIGELLAKGDRFRLQKLFKTVTKWIFAISMLIFIAVALTAQPLLAVFGAEFVGGAYVLYILAFGHLANVSTGAVGWMLTMSGHSKVHMLNSAVSTLLAIVLSFFLIPTYGVIGAAIVVSLVEVLINAARMVEVTYLMRIHPYSWDLVKPVMAGLMAFVIVYLLQREIVCGASSMFWTSVVKAGLALTFYIIVLLLSHWPQVKAIYPLLCDQLS